MKYRQIYLEHARDREGLVIKINPSDGIDRVDRQSYKATPYIWSYPEEILTEQEALNQFVEATIEECLVEIDKAQLVIRQLQEAHAQYRKKNK